MVDDNTIIQHYWDRDECAVSETADKYGSFCTSIAENILENREDAKECVNDTYLKTWNTIPPQRPRVLPAFIGRIVRNLAFDRYSSRNAARRGGGQTGILLDELEECIPDRTADVECDEKELARVINEFAGTLSERNRNIFVLRYWYSESVKDIALSQKMTENSVSAVLNRVRRRLRRYLTERGFEP